MILKTPALRFGVDRQHFENEENVISLSEFSSNTNPKRKKKSYWLFSFQIYSAKSGFEKHLMRCQIEKTVY